MAGTMKMFCIRKDICSHRKKNPLFLPCNMAAVQNLYSRSVRTMYFVFSGLENMFKDQFFRMSIVSRIALRARKVETSSWHDKFVRYCGILE